MSSILDGYCLRVHDCDDENDVHSIGDAWNVSQHVEATILEQLRDILVSSQMNQSRQ